jgi:hypothetical protein
MMKSNLIKSGILFSVMLILVMAVSMTAYAIADGTENDNGGGMATDQPIQDALVQETAGAVIVVCQVGENDRLEEIINGIIYGTQGVPLEQGNYSIIIVVPTQGQEAVDDIIAAVASMGVQHTEHTPEPPAQTAPPAQQPVSPTPSQPAAAATPEIPPQSNSQVEIITRAELSGNPLHGADFSIYRADDSQRVGEATTDENGRATISLAQGEYYMRNDSVQYGYLRERARIFFTVGASGDVTVEVTIQRDAGIPDVGSDNIAVPKTGESPPVKNYALGTLFLAVALLCGIGLLSHRKQGHYKRKGALAYA